ncbi:formate dehydrogenase, variant 2 [Cryptococcus amylolentus CBS 6039]|uniref:Formate dehydrogenase, variant 2 n=1 Tax=Cryptococcus amylolentus CBS 6039 TaxID=1295533 RepID=A0A1E3I6D9_9TREE|nr:formate dehydrogenase, variant 2 [Cryptococcus amylolentus CBS 6039]ODN84078.1 formate dehydrogenase, variant 2 [Cryptococcus amylolentus CBS 6039]
MVKVLAILYSGGQSAKEEPRLLGTIENQLGIANWLKEQGHELVVTDDKEGSSSEFQKHLPDTEILITTPFHPGYLTADLIEKAPKLKLCVTAGVGSDHIDLNAANKHKITVAEVSGSNVVSVAEHVLMTILTLVRNFVPAHEQIVNDDWNVAAVARNAFDLEGKVVGTVGAGRIGYRVLQRLQPFDCKELLWFDYADLPPDAAKAIKARRVEKLEDFVAQCDVITIVRSLSILHASSNLQSSELPPPRTNPWPVQQGTHLQDEARILAHQHRPRRHRRPDRRQGGSRVWSPPRLRW